MKSVSVFCGSSTGNHPVYLEAAKTLGKILAQNQIHLVYGGAGIGLMGAIANSVMENGGKVTGVIPTFLKTKEVEHTGLTHLIECETMHERKKKMFELSEGFIAMPGGFGTLEEVIEILTWRQLSLHHYPIGFLNINGFYNELKNFFQTMTINQFVKPEHQDFALFDQDPLSLIVRMRKNSSAQRNSKNMTSKI